MGYTVNPSAFSSAFTVPCAVVEKHIKLATDLQLRVLLCVLKDIRDPISPVRIAATLGAHESEVEDCLLYWSQNGVLVGETPAKAEKENSPIKKDVLPSRVDVATRGLEDPKVAMLLREAQLRFGRNLKTNESAVLVWMYDDLGLNVSVILLLLQYAASQKKCNITFMQKTAQSWYDAGVETVTDAEKIIAESVVKKLAWNRVCGIFGIEKRNPSETEEKLSALWTDEWKLEDGLLKLAYDVCVDTKSKFSFAYTSKIIENWHKNGCKTEADAREYIAKNKKESNLKKGSFAAYDLDAFEKMLNSD